MDLRNYVLIIVNYVTVLNLSSSFRFDVDPHPHGPFQPRRPMPRRVFGEDCQPCSQRQTPYHRQGRQRQEPTATRLLGKVLRLRRHSI